MSTLATMSCNFAMDYLGTFYLHPPMISCQWMKLYSRISGGYLFMSTPALVSLDANFFLNILGLSFYIPPQQSFQQLKLYS